MKAMPENTGMYNAKLSIESGLGKKRTQENQKKINGYNRRLSLRTWISFNEKHKMKDM